MNDRADGLLGGFVIMRPDEVYRNANGEVVQVKRQYYSVLQDWATTPSSEQWLCHVHSTMKWVGFGFDEHDGGYRKQCWAPRRTFDGSNVGGSIPLEAILVGDQGWYSQEDLRSRPSALPLTTYLIRTGEHIIIRVVNGGVSQGFMLWIEDHEITIVAADGASVVPKAFDALILFPGERYDIMVRGLDAPKKKVYRMIFETMDLQIWSTKRLRSKVEIWISHAKCTQESRCVVLNCPFGDFPPNYNYTCYSTHLLENAEKVEDTEILEKKQFDSGYQEIFMNMHFDNHIGIPYYYNDRMDLIAKKCDREKCDRHRADHWDHDCDCFFYCHFKLNDIIQITVYNMGDGGTVGSGYSHPLHIHGTHFYVMKIGYAQYHPENGTISAMNPDIPCTNTQQRCVDLHWTNPDWQDGNVEGMQTNPSFRDTVNIPTGGYVTLSCITWEGPLSRFALDLMRKFRHHRKAIRIHAEYMSSQDYPPQNIT
ncbi:multicopper oxidase domain-containing protein [Ditylenchus destructor]|uniref:Multicopper oxidase domain-containing protein n=1 Tax=Ditylenchus destructor TaxID=166010 RepID=A0AAD4N6G4_9BILA|nr:multicopper oxidase domain-containing protein [Ditylenchus destructor]